MILDDLWGGAIRNVDFDVRTQTIILSVDVTYFGERTSHKLDILDVSDFRFVNSIPTPWTYAELSEIYLTKDSGSGRWNFDFMIWSEDCTMTGQCGAILLDGVLVEDS